MGIMRIVAVFLRALVADRLGLAAENLALRQQLVVLQRSVRRPQIRRQDRILWVWLARLWSGWRSALRIVQPATVVGWHRQGFGLYWRWKSRRRNSGRPKLETEVRKLIRRLAEENPTWGAPRIQSELRLLGHDVAESSVAKYMERHSKPPSQNWRTFLQNHVGQMAAIDFFTVPTVSFRVLYVFLVLRHQRRRLVHFNVTDRPNAQWAAQQIIETFPYEESPRFLLRDRDAIYGHDFSQRVEHQGIEQVLTAYRAPWQNPFVERLIGSIRRECLDHLIVLNQQHLLSILSEYFTYYHEARTHLSLDCNAPIPRAVQSLENGQIVATAYLGGLHHRYQRAA